MKLATVDEERIEASFKDGVLKLTVPKTEAAKPKAIAIRALAFKWVRILLRMWQTRTPYDEQRYTQQLQRRNSPLLPLLTNTTA